MQYFTPKALKSESSFDAAREEYWRHIKEIRSELPSALFDLHYRYTLHDAEITSLSIANYDKDIFILLDGCRNGSLADTDRVLFGLHFIDSAFSKRILNDCVGYDILYVEVTRGESRKWRFSASTTRPKRQDSFSIEFNDFGYYIHDYRTGPK